MKGSPRSRARGAPLASSVVKKAISFSKTITVDGVSGVGFGTVVLAGLPQGNIEFLGAVAYLQLTKLAATGVQDTFDGDFSIGTAPTADLTLSGSEIDIIPSTALGAATAGVSPRVRSTHTAAIAGTVYDNTDGSLELNLNVLIDDANINAAGQTLTAAGVLTILYAMLGDD